VSDPVTAWSTLALAIASFVAVGVSFWAVRKQAQSSADLVLETRKQADSFSLSVSVDICLKLTDRFDSPELKNIRRNAAEALLANENLIVVDDVFDFFETVGLYVRKKALDDEIAHAMFFHWVNLYWHAGKEYILRSQQRSESIWHEFEKLHGTLLQIEREQDPDSRDINPSPEDIRKLLQQETME